MSRVAVVFPPLRVSRDFIDYPYFADLGAVQAAAVLSEAGHEVELCDALALEGADLEPAGEGFVQLGAPLAAVVERIPASDVVVIAYTPFHRPPAREPVLATLLRELRGAQPSTPILLADLYQSGQHYVDAAPAAVFGAYPEVDAWLRYEAENVLAALVGALAAKGRPPAPRAVDGSEVSELDRLPAPAWDRVDLSAYFRLQERIASRLGRPSWAFPIVGASLPFVTSRGCPFRCVHCSSNPGLPAGAPKRQRRYSSSALASQLDRLVALGARRVQVLDELANVNERHFDALLELIRERDLGLEIPNGLRADYVTERHLELLRGRITTLSVSAESGVPRVVRDVVGKELDLSNIERTAQLSQKADIPLLVHFMIGLPGETRAEINQTLEFALSLWQRFGAFPSVQFATPLPGTRLAKEIAASGRPLPLVEDYGPHFQRIPSPSHEAISPSELREFKETFDLRLAASRGPKKIILNATYKCNNRCTFCAVGTRTQLDGDFERQRELLLKYRNQGVTLLDIDGGEPTLYPHLFRLIRLARRIGYEKVNVTTNGRMAAYEEYAARLCTSGVTSLLFSIHGPSRHLHAANVGVPEAFDQTLAGVKNVTRLAPEGVELGANVTLTLSNHRHLGEIAALVHELGLRWLNIQFLTPFGRATEAINPDTQTAAEIAMRVIDEWHERMKLSVINLPWCFMPGYEKYLVGDLLKLERNMLFVNNEEVNLFEYLRGQREHRTQCEGCTRRAFCGGFYRMHDVPEPEWLIAPSDLVRPIAATGLTGPAR
jgi:MoaA/NifB/PqqE/SkfB family radical SAM enzyme